MKIKTATVLTDLQGKPLLEQEKEVTLALVLSAALITAGKSEPERAYQLAQKVSAGKEVDLKVEDVTFIKECLKAVDLPVLYSGQALTLLDV